MSAPYPVVDLELWLRFAAGVAVLLWLPGHLLLGRFLKHRPKLVRLAMSLTLGMLIAPAWSQAASAMGVGVRPWTYLLTVVPLTLVAGFLPGYRRDVSLLDADEPSPGFVDMALAVAVVLSATLVVLGFHDFTAPPHVHDASNHSFMTLRVTETGSMRADEVFGAPYGPAPLPYLVGLHATASLLAQATGLAPYVTTWFLALMAVALMALPLTLLWQEWRFGPKALAMAALFVASNQFVPTGALYWGGFGALAGMLLVPILTLLLTRFWMTGSVWLGALAGLGAGSLLLVHGSELPVVGLVTLVTVLGLRLRPRWRSLAWVAFGALVVSVGLEFFTAIIPSYLRDAMDTAPPLERLGKSLERTLHASGKWAPLQVLWALGLILGIRARRWRSMAVTAAALGLISVSLATWADPISELLSTPFYRQAARVRYVLMFFMAPLMALAALWIADRTRLSARAPRSRAILITLLLAGLVMPAQPGIHRVYRNMQKLVPFDADDYTHARGITERVNEDEWVANGLDDGSTWAMHVSDRRFLVPTWWRLRALDGLEFPQWAAGILKDPWPDAIRERSPRPSFAYASDTRFSDHLVFDRTLLDADPRFEPVLVGEHSTLYRILW